MRGWVMLAMLFTLAVCGARGQQPGAPAASGVLAVWEATDTGPREDGLRLLSGGDGETEMTRRDGSRCASLKPNSAYMYFDVSGEAARVQGPVYLVVEYFDNALGGALMAAYDSGFGDALADAYRPNDDGAGGTSLGRKAWQTAALKLERPRFAGRQNLGADFRLTGMPLYVRRVVLTTRRPAQWAEWARVDPGDLEPVVRIGAGGELILGGFDPTRRDDAAQVRALEAVAPALKRMGFTSHESYVRWNLCEIAPGRYDWSVYDPFVEVYKRHGLKWVPFLIIGSPYSLPEWYFKSQEQQGYVCLEHGQESHVQSLWNPAMRGHVARFLKAFAEHYRDSGVIESVLLGVTGNYGEAIYIASGNDWTADVWGEYHTHAGFWAGDPYAVKDFQARLTRQYKRIDRLNAAWGADYAAFGDVRPFLPTGDGHNNRAKLDLVNWYIGSMNEWSRFWMTETRKQMPDAGLYLCTGGHAPPEHGADFGEQCRIAASVNGGVRITNEASDYALNYSLTRWVASAGRQYGAYYAFEPAGAVDANGVITRIYNATASGAKGLHYYHPIIFGSEQAGANFLKYGSYFQQRDPVVEVAVYYPQTDIKLRGQRFLEPVQALRERFDFDLMSDNQIRDGGLKTVRALVMLQGTIAEAETWQRIAAWVKSGGVLLYAGGIGPLETVEGREPPLMKILRGAAAPGKGRVVVREGAANGAYMDFCARTLAESPELTPAARAAIAADGRADGVFLTLTEPGARLWLNTTDREITRDGVIIPAHGIAERR